MSFILLELYNICVVSCFTYLSISFDKWWLVLLGLLFIRSYKLCHVDNEEDRQDIS